MQRQTLQRKMIYEAIQELGHSTIQDLIEYFQSIEVNIAIGTIYRNLQVLEEEGKVKKIPTKFKAVIYEDACQMNHDHFICSECFCVEDINQDKVFVPIKTESGDLYVQEIKVYYGICKECLKNKQC